MSLGRNGADFLALSEPLASLIDVLGAERKLNHANALSSHKPFF